MQKTKWIIFDADNTLWDIESLYDRAREEFCKFLLIKLEESGRNQKRYVSLSLIEQAQRHRDLQLYRSLGYSSGRFARSFEDTLSFFMPSAAPEISRHVEELATSVFEQMPTIAEDLESVLSHFAKDFSLAIITAGDEAVQRSRLREFRLKDRFAVTQIVPKKTPEVFEAFCKNHEVDRSQSWVIGDSIPSDILPAKDVGLRTIHLKAPNWAAEHATIPEGVISIERLSQIIDIIR